VEREQGIMENQEKASYRWPMLGYLSFINLVFNGIAVNAE